MPKKVTGYTLPRDRYYQIDFPDGAKVLGVSGGDDTEILYIEEPIEEFTAENLPPPILKSRTFRSFGIGSEIPDGAEYIGTTHTRGNFYVTRHIYEIKG